MINLPAKGLFYNNSINNTSMAMQSGRLLHMGINTNPQHKLDAVSINY